MQNLKLLDNKNVFNGLTYSIYLSSWFSLDVAQFVAAQICLETGYLKSEVYLKNHNLFGMRCPKKRVTFASRENLGHAYYSSCYDSFKDYLLWLVYNGFSSADLMSFDKFSSKMRSSAFNPSEKYVDTIIKIIKLYGYE